MNYPGKTITLKWFFNCFQCTKVNILVGIEREEEKEFLSTFKSKHLLSFLWNENEWNGCVEIFRKHKLP